MNPTSTASNSEPVTPLLCRADDATFWPWLGWPDFARWPRKSSTLVVVPITGFADWGLGHPLDLEETLALAILETAAKRVGDESDFRLLTLPPLRFVTGTDAGCAFAVDPPSAHRLIEEVVASVAASGFTRVLLYNSSPWNEELTEVAARDIRIARGIQMFCVHLSALGFDLHPTRSQTRRTAQTLGTWLLGAEPERSPADKLVHPPVSPACWPEVECVRPLTEEPASLAEATTASPPLLTAAGAHLHRLLGEIAARPPLAHEGKLPLMQA